MRSTIHEMRNALAVSVANIEAFIDGKFLPSRDRLEAVLGALRTVDRLIDQLPGVAAPQPVLPRRVPVDMCALVEREAVALEPVAEAAGIRLHVDRCALTHPECEIFMCDPVQVGQAVTNVLLNAIKYTGRGGLVTLYCHQELGVLALDIGDSGPGVPIDERTSIFALDVRGSAGRLTAGSGVGLAVVQGIVDAHGGSVSVVENSTGGALFTIRLPGFVETPNASAACGEHSPLVHASVTPVA